MSEINDIVRENQHMIEKMKVERTTRIPPALVLRMLMMVRRAQARNAGGKSASDEGSDDEGEDDTL